MPRQKPRANRRRRQRARAKLWRQRMHQLVAARRRYLELQLLERAQRARRIFDLPADFEFTHGMQYLLDYVPPA